MVMAESVEEILDDTGGNEEGEGGIGCHRAYEHRKQGEEDGIDQDCRSAVAVTRFPGDVLQPRIKPGIRVPPEKRRGCAQLGFRDRVMRLPNRRINDSVTHQGSVQMALTRRRAFMGAVSRERCRCRVAGVRLHPDRAGTPAIDGKGSARDVGQSRSGGGKHPLLILAWRAPQVSEHAFCGDCMNCLCKNYRPWVKQYAPSMTIRPEI